MVVQTAVAHTRRILMSSALAATLAISLGGFRSFEANFAPSSDLWPRWQAHDAGSTTTIDANTWDRLIKTYLQPDPDGVDVFDYAAVTADDRTALEAYLAEMAALPISTYSRPEQMAYWLNLYNALTVEVILEHYPVKSIRDIDTSPGWFADGPWDQKLIRVENEDLTLNDIEHRILRPIWKDARIHYGVNCASIGCPDLQLDAFTGSNLDAMLDAAARDYVNDVRGVSLSGDRVQVSSIYDWFFEDFGGTEESLLTHLIAYAEPELAADLMSIGQLHESDYDWRLNGPGAPAAGQ
ncbi:DUF547 domain-containing protein [Pyruvatibacter sp.]|uniref:DUF547 domain-containing protein n=1 Tax=Pyruvatibacter sp. TaxID=1981328 RepID=UPI003264DDC5